jgi:hypothetical protein
MVNKTNPDYDSELGINFVIFKQGEDSISFLMECVLETTYNFATFYLPLEIQDQIYNEYEDILMSVIGIRSFPAKVCNLLTPVDSVMYSISFYNIELNDPTSPNADEYLRWVLMS